MKNILQFLKSLVKFVVACGLLLGIIVPVLAQAQVSTNFWKLSSNILSPILSTWTLQVTNQGSDPTGSNGAIYYNTGSNTFRCFTNGSWGSCSSGGGGSSTGGTWSTTTSQVAGHLINYPNNSTDVVVVGASATTTANYWIDPNIIQAFFANASSTAFTAKNFFATTETVTGNSTLTNATTTSLAISNIPSGSILKTTTGGSILAAVAGTDFDTFPWPFGSTNSFGESAISTTTSIQSAGRYFSSSTAASQFPFASTTALSAVTFYSTNENITGNSSLTNATSTSFFTTVASTSIFYGANLSSCTGNNALKWTGGLFSCGSVSGGGSSPWATTTSQMPGVLVNYSLNNTDVVTVGSNSTTSASFFVDPNTATMFFGTTTQGNSTLTIGSTGNEWSIGENTAGKVFEISSSTTLGINDGLKIDKNLLVTMNNASTTGISATGPSYFQGINNFSWAVSTSTTICPDNTPTGQCQYIGGTGLQQAITDGWNTIHLKNGTYTITTPIYIPRGGFSIVGEGDASVIQYNGTTLGAGQPAISNATGLELGDMTFQDFRINETGAGGKTTCFDTSQIVTSKFTRIHCDKQLIGFMASTSQSYYNVYDTDDVSNLTSVAGSLTSFGFYLGDNGSGDGGPIDNTLINPHVTSVSVSTASSTAYYFNSHSIKCISCDSENSYIGMHLGQFASDFNASVYLEANKINLTIDASAAQVGGLNISGNISSARTIAEDIVDNGAVGLCVNARVEFAAVNYCTNVKQGFGTKNPSSALEVSDNNNLSVPGLANQSLLLFGDRGPALTISHGTGNTDSHLFGSGSLSAASPRVDLVIATSSVTNSEPIGVRFAVGNIIGTDDVAIQPEVQGSGYAIFEGYSSTSISASTAGTWISSRGSPVILGPNRSEVLRATTGGFIGISSTTPGTRLSIGNTSSNFINISESSTSTFSHGINVSGGCLAVRGTCIAAGSGAVSSVSNGDGTLSISPTTGAVVASLNLGHVNSWVALQSFLNASSTLFSSSYASSTAGVFGSVSLTNVTGVSGNCLHADVNGKITGVGADCGSSAVNNVSNSDGSLTISPTTGSVVASLNPGHANAFTALQTFSNASSTQLTGTLLYAPTILQNSPAFNQFVQNNPTDSMVVGNLVQSGGVFLATTSLTLTPNQFCGVGEFISASTTGTNIAITLPNLQWIQNSGTCGQSAWSSSFASQFIYNNGTTTITETATDTNIAFVYAPGTPTTLQPGGSWLVSGQLTNEYQVQGFNAPNNKLRVYIQAFGTNASTTLLSANYASSTQYFGANLGNCVAGQYLTWSNGVFGCANDQNTAGSVFTYGTLTFNTTTAATTTSIWTQGIFFSSSTVAASQFPYASSTAFTAGNLFATNVTYTNATGTSEALTQLTVSGSTTITGILNVSGAAPSFINFASTTAFTALNETITNSTSTSLFASTASTTQFYGALLQACNSSTQKLTWSGGLFGCGVDQTGTGAPYPFTPSTNFNVGVQATTGIPWFQNGIQASSTSQFDYSTTTYLTTTNGAAFATTNGKVGIATTSPFSTLGVNGFIDTGPNFGYRMDGNLILYGTSTSNSVFVGNGAGNGIINAQTISTQAATALGFQALNTATSSSIKDTAVGYQALKGDGLSSNTGSNTAVGYQALTAITTANLDTAIGAGALTASLSGNGNTVIGNSAASTLQTGGFNVVIGSTAFNNASMTGGSRNIVIGRSAGSLQTSGSDNILIGEDNDLPNPVGSAQLNIGGAILGQGLNSYSNTGTGFISKNVTVGIASSTPIIKFVIQANSTDTGIPTLFSIASSTASATTTLMFVNNIGQVGISTSSPDATLTISNAITGIAGLIIHTWTNVTNAFSIVNAAGTTVLNVDTTATSPGFAIGTSSGATSQFNDVGLFGAPPLNNSFFEISSSSQAATTTLFKINNVGQFFSSSSPPVLTSCGTAPSINRGTNNSGTITTGTGVLTGCTLTFAQAYPAAPTCTVTSRSATNTLAYTITASAITITDASLDSDVWDYVCLGSGQ